MSSTRQCLAQLSRLSLSASRPSVQTAASLQPLAQKRGYAAKQKPQAVASKYASKLKAQRQAEKKARKPRTTFREYDIRDADQYALLDAMRYIRAAEVGRPATSVKYEMSLKLKSPKNGPVVRNRLRLPHPVKTDIRICVIAPPGSKIAEEAIAAGAVLVGEEEIFEAVKDGKINFDRCIAHIDSVPKLNKAGIARILGPRGMMPSAKQGTVVKDPAVAVKEMVGGAEYRERLGVVRMAIGQLGYTPEMLAENIKIFMDSVKKDLATLSDKAHKELAEVVLSSTNGPGITLNGEFASKESKITSKDLTVL